MKYVLTFHFVNGDALASVPFDEQDVYEIRQRIEMRDKLIAFTVSEGIERVIAPWHVAYYEIRHQPDAPAS